MCVGSLFFLFYFFFAEFLLERFGFWKMRMISDVVGHRVRFLPYESHYSGFEFNQCRKSPVINGLHRSLFACFTYGISTFFRDSYVFILYSKSGLLD